LNATVAGVAGGSAPGGLTYSSAAGTVLPAGSSTLRITAAATDNYNEASREVTIRAYDAARISGVAFTDYNHDGVVGFGEAGVAGVVVALTGTDMNGQPVSVSATSDSSGYYSFDNLLPGSYVTGGTGTLTAGSPNHWDVSFDTAGTGGSTSSTNNFALVPGASDQLKKGQTAGIGFWHNKNGQALIQALNGASTSTQLANWLAERFPNMFGNMAGKRNAQVAAIYQQVFAYKGDKTEAQFFATALSIYASSSLLAGGNYAASYGFTVTQGGAEVATTSVGSNGAVVGVANNTVMTVMDIMRALDAQATAPITATEVGRLFLNNPAMRTKATSLLGAINDTGGI
jgi:hypothetical protein